MKENSPGISAIAARFFYAGGLQAGAALPVRGADTQLE
jgi:hypothetical protein